jgi:AraC-like DNA-binding protein
MEKVYQEPTYSRADLARECSAPESTVSRVINVHFGKSFPQLMNERRIADAKRLLQQTDAPVAKIASEVGFNSLPSFNRVFKDMTGDSPSSFRKSSSGGSLSS